MLTFFISHWSQNLLFKVLIIAFKSLVYLLPCRKHSSSISCYMYTFYNCICLSVCCECRATTFEWVDIENLIFGMAVLLTLSRSNLNINVIGSRSWTSNENSNLPTWILNEFDLSEIRTWTFN